MKQHGWLLDAGALSLILAVGALLRFWRLAKVPPGLFHDEAFNGLDALRVLDGYRPIFFPANAGREPLFIYLQAAAVAVAGASPLALRATSALVGLATLPAIYFLGRELLGDTSVWRGRAVGLLAAAAMAASYWHLSFSRLGFRGILLPFLSTVAFALLVRGLRKGEIRSYLGAGLCLGLCAYAYLAARFLPLVLVTSAVVWAVSRVHFRGGISWEVEQPGWRLGLILFLGVSLAIFAPLSAYYAIHPEDFSTRIADIAVGEAATGNPLLAVGSNALRVLGMFGWQGDTHQVFNLPGRPALDALSLVGFTLGLGVAVWRWRNIAYSLFLVWLLIMLLPTVLSTEAPHTLRAIGALPPTCLLAALGLWTPLEFLLEEKDRCWRRRVLTLSVAVILLVGGTLTWRDYFGRWATDPGTYYAFQGDLWDLTQDVLDMRDEEDIALLLSLYDQATVAFGLTRSFSQQAGVEGTELSDARSLCLITTENARNSSFVLLHSDGGEVHFLPPLADDGERRVRESLDKIPPYLLRDAYGRQTAQVYCLADGKELFESLSDERIPFEAIWQGGVGLVCYSMTPHRAEPGDRVQLTLYWKAARPVEEDYRSFVHLVDVEGKTWVGVDDHPVAEVYPTSSWAEGQILPGVFALMVPSQAPWGRYAFEVGLEDPSSGGRVTLLGSDGGTAENRVLLGSVKVRTEEDIPPEGIGHPMSVRLGTFVDLLGYEASSMSVSPGGELSVTLYWRARSTTDQDYTVFVHLLHRGGQIAAQRDSQPRDGFYPTSIWEPGEVVPDEYAIILLPDLPPGDYELVAGMYYLPTGERLLIKGPSGGDMGNTIVLGSIKVE